MKPYPTSHTVEKFAAKLVWHWPMCPATDNSAGLLASPPTHQPSGDGRPGHIEPIPASERLEMLAESESVWFPRSCLWCDAGILTLPRGRKQASAAIQPLALDLAIRYWGETCSSDSCPSDSFGYDCEAPDCGLRRHEYSFDAQWVGDAVATALEDGPLAHRPSAYLANWFAARVRCTCPDAFATATVKACAECRSPACRCEHCGNGLSNLVADDDAERERRRKMRRGVRGMAADIAQRDGGWLCAYCGRDVTDDFHVDHVHPVSKAASYKGDDINELANLVLAWPPCNVRKGAKL